MGFRKMIGQFVVLALLLSQLALAQHATVHVLEDPGFVSQGVSGTPAHSDHSKSDKYKVCGICLLSQGLSHADLTAVFDLGIAPVIDAFALPGPVAAIARHDIRAYDARGPPPFLS